ncbi:MAG: methyltransferase domain-containing protein [Chloroflexota bacterium]|nr:methyltransferase domain-containing protein [Chloroflexota bacterium]
MDISSQAYHAARKSLITSMIDRNGRGLEIGPSHNPAAPKSEGYDVHIVDHMDQLGLQEKYKDDAGINLENIEPVDHVWQGGSLSRLIGDDASYDWIIAAHVIEHMPDLIAFIQDCQVLLRPGGIISLVVPDKRYCFDHLRRRSSTGDVIQAHVESRKRHTPGQVYDHFSSACKLDESGSWHRNSLGKVGFVHGPHTAESMLKHSLSSDEYLDVHGWVFTPSSFRLIIGDLNALGYIRIDENSFSDTRDCEFFVSYANHAPSSGFDRLSLSKAAIHEERQAFFP